MWPSLAYPNTSPRFGKLPGITPSGGKFCIRACDGGRVPNLPFCLFSLGRLKHNMPAEAADPPALSPELYSDYNFPMDVSRDLRHLLVFFEIGADFPSTTVSSPPAPLSLPLPKPDPGLCHSPAASAFALNVQLYHKQHVQFSFRRSTPRRKQRTIRNTAPPPHAVGARKSRRLDRSFRRYGSLQLGRGDGYQLPVSARKV